MNTINDWQTKAKITNPDRLALWQAVFGGDEVPIVSIVPAVADFPGVGEQRYYSMDLKATKGGQGKQVTPKRPSKPIGCVICPLRPFGRGLCAACYMRARKRGVLRQYWRGKKTNDE